MLRFSIVRDRLRLLKSGVQFIDRSGWTTAKTERDEKIEMNELLFLRGFKTVKSHWRLLAVRADIIEFAILG